MDEAGRGPVLGPLVFGIVVADAPALRVLEAAGVKDSKRLSEMRRRILYNTILEHAREVSLRLLRRCLCQPRFH